MRSHSSAWLVTISARSQRSSGVPGFDSGSAAASERICCARRASRAVPSRACLMCESRSPCALFARSSCVMTPAIGVRSWCAAFAMNRACRCCASRRASIPFSAPTRASARRPRRSSNGRGQVERAYLDSRTHRGAGRGRRRHDARTLPRGAAPRNDAESAASREARALRRLRRHDAHGPIRGVERDLQAHPGECVPNAHPAGAGRRRHRASPATAFFHPAAVVDLVDAVARSTASASG